ncbi:hypothetical protein H4Q26_015793 [Puccinia striiformis f. sp. tritici PST-130]|nr:hypothetical protein H4Q26_015793 [Puccinia striiformis f. sp. tritici PST-130]
MVVDQSTYILHIFVTFFVKQRQIDSVLIVKRPFSSFVKQLFHSLVKRTSTFTHPSKACSISSSTPPTLSAPRMNPNYQARLQQCRALPAPLLNSGQPLNQTTWHSTSQPPGLSPQSNPNTSFQGRPQQSVHVTPQRTNHQVQFQPSGRPPTQESLIRNFFTVSPTGKRIFCPEDTLEEILDGCNVAHPAHGAPQGQDFNSSGGQHRLEQDTGVRRGLVPNAASYSNNADHSPQTTANHLIPARADHSTQTTTDHSTQTTADHPTPTTASHLTTMVADHLTPTRANHLTAAHL